MNLKQNTLRPLWPIEILKNYPKVHNASVNLVTKTAFIEIEEPNKNIKDVIQTLTSKGFPSSERNYETSSKKNELEKNENFEDLQIPYGGIYKESRKIRSKKYWFMDQSECNKQ